MNSPSIRCDGCYPAWMASRSHSSPASSIPSSSSSSTAASCSRNRRCSTLWPHVVVEENNLNQAISTLRRVFGETRDDHRFIVTKPGRGYRFVAHVDAVPTVVPAPNLSRPLAEPIGRLSSPRAPGGVANLKPNSGLLLLGSLVLAMTALFFAAWPHFGPTPEAGTSTSLGPAVRVTPITAYVGNELAPALSPDGESVVFPATTKPEIATSS